jgi:hypothetical protein
MKKIITVDLMLLIAGVVTSCGTENGGASPCGELTPRCSGLKVDLYLNNSIVPANFHKPASFYYSVITAGHDTLIINRLYIFQGSSKFIINSRSLPVPNKRTKLLFLPNASNLSTDILSPNLRPLVKGNLHNPVFMNGEKEYTGTYKAFHFKISPVSDSAIAIPNYNNYTVSPL